MSQCPHCGAELPAGATICPSCGRGVVAYAPPPSVPAGYGVPGVPAAPSGTGGTVALFVVLGAGCALFAVAAIGIFAAIFIPNFLDALHKAKQKRTVADLRTLETAIESYNADKETYPNVGSANELAPLLTAYGYSGKMIDGWQHPLRYTCVSPAEAGCGSYELASPGRDGVFQNEPGQYAQGSFEPTAYDEDIIVRDGSFLRWPQKP
jgi:general secretion pathway protein G